MKKNYLVCGLIVTTLITLVAGVLLLLPSQLRPGVTKENFNRIKKGMREEEVHAIFGAFPKDGGAQLDGGVALCCNTWCGDDGSSAHIVFTFNSEEGCKVETTNWTDSPETAWQRVLRWLQRKKT